MKVITEELERCEVLLTIEIDAIKEQDMLKKEAKKLSKELKIPGFRLGKAPYKTVVSRFGLEAIQQAVLEKSLDGLVEKAISQIEFTPIGELNLETVNWNPLTIKVKFPVKPIVELSNYHDIRLDVVELADITEDEVDNALKEIQNQTAVWVTVERPAEVGDLISLFVLEKEGDNVLSKDESVEYELVDNDKIQPEFEKHLLGVVAGDEKSFIIDYPDDFSNSYYAGKTISFEIKVHTVKLKEVDQLDDAFAQSATDFETLDILKDNMRFVIEKSRKNEYDSNLSKDVLKRIIEEAKEIKWSPLFETQQVENELKLFEDYVTGMGLTFEAYLNIRGKSQDEFKLELQKKVSGKIQTLIVIRELAELEQISYTKEEVEKHASDIKSSNLDYATDDLIMIKTLQRLAKIAKGELTMADGNEQEVATTNSADELKPVAIEAEQETDVSAVTNDEEDTEETDTVEAETASTTE